VSALVAVESTEGVVTVVVAVESPVVFVSSVVAGVELQDAKKATATSANKNFFIVFFNF
jgi:hypothetical protein